MSVQGRMLFTNSISYQHTHKKKKEVKRTSEVDSLNLFKLEHWLWEFFLFEWRFHIAWVRKKKLYLREVRSRTIRRTGGYVPQLGSIFAK